MPCPAMDMIGYLIEVYLALYADPHMETAASLACEHDMFILTADD